MQTNEKEEYTGDLVSVDTFFVGTLKGVGKVYLQSVLDCHSQFAWGRLYTPSMSLLGMPNCFLSAPGFMPWAVLR